MNKDKKLRLNTDYADYECSTFLNNQKIVKNIPIYNKRRDTYDF